jgi:hypothetical protein
MVVTGTKVVSGDRKVLNQHLPVDKMTIGIVHTYFAHADGFNLCAKQNNPRYKFFNKFVVKTGPLVTDINVILELRFHT